MVHTPWNRILEWRDASEPRVRRVMPPETLFLTTALPLSATGVVASRIPRREPGRSRR